MNRIITRTMCILLALVLMSSSAVSFTYAEYARGSSMSDNARSTKWGVTVDVTGGAFATKYVSSTEFDGMDTSVKSSTTDDILAPGTAGTFTGIRCTGTPEVSVKVEITPDLQLTNWVANGKFYCPLKITVNGTTYHGLDYPSSAAFETAVENAIKAAEGVYGPNTDLSQIPGLNGDYTWLWEFDGTDYGGLKDEYDRLTLELDDPALDPNAPGLTTDQKNAINAQRAELTAQRTAIQTQMEPLRAVTDAKDSALIGKAQVALSVGCTVYQVGEEPPSQNKDLDDDDDLEIGDGGPIIWF